MLLPEDLIGFQHQPLEHHLICSYENEIHLRRRLTDIRRELTLL